MKKDVILGVAALLLVVCLIGGANLSVYAANNNNTIQPYYVGATNASCALSIASGKATCRGQVALRSGYHASLTLKLQQSSDGKSWSTLKTWTASGSTIEKPYYVLSGYKYRATLNAKVYNSGGTLVDNITKVSATKP